MESSRPIQTEGQPHPVRFLVLVIAAGDPPVYPEDCLRGIRDAPLETVVLRVTYSNTAVGAALLAELSRRADFVLVAAEAVARARVLPEIEALCHNWLVPVSTDATDLLRHQATARPLVVGTDVADHLRGVRDAGRIVHINPPEA
jgi:hypothetical protein